MTKIIGILGLFLILLVAYLLSNNKKKINYRTVIGAMVIQITFAFIVLYIPIGRAILNGMSIGVLKAIDAGKEGLNFVFGPLADGSMGFIFAVSVLAIIVFSSSLIAVLYYIRIMPLIINTLGLGIHKLLKTSRAESLSATTNIFLGQTEAPLVVKPFINSMTRSELFAVMVGGLASVAGAVLAGYASLGIEVKYLIAAAFMAAPAGLLMAKIMLPETETPKQTLEELKLDGDELDTIEPSNVIEAAADGASMGLKLALNVGAMLIAFIGLVTLVNMILSGIGGLFGFEHLSFQMLLGYLFAPVSFVMGVPWNEATQVGTYLGEKVLFNEFVAYVDFAKSGVALSEHTKVITIFALCGFANISSIGILLGGLGVMAPKQKRNIAQLAIKAVIAGTLANLFSATIAGLITTI